MGNSAEFKKRPLSLVPPPAAGEVAGEGCASEGVVMPVEMRPLAKAGRQLPSRPRGQNIFQRVRSVTGWGQARTVEEILVRTGRRVGLSTWRTWESGQVEKCFVDVIDELYRIIAEHAPSSRRAG
jgi:hypothetical protein